MTLNEGFYCLVDLVGTDEVLDGPRLLPQNWEGYYNLNNMDLWSDSALIAILWYPYILIDDGAPGPEYNRSLSEFDFNVSDVTQTAIYTEWTQEQKDRNANTTFTDSQRMAQDLAFQTRNLLTENESRLNSGKPSLIPAEDTADVQTYLGTLYDAVDNPTILPQEPPGSTRQLTEVPGENVDRGVVRRKTEDWAGTDYYGLTYTLYTDIDATGMSFKVHLANGTYLSTYNLVEQSPGVWFAETNIIGAFATLQELQYELFKGVSISQRRVIPVDVEEQVFDLRWLNGI